MDKVAEIKNDFISYVYSKEKSLWEILYTLTYFLCSAVLP